MEDVTLAHAKEHLEELVRRAAAGEEVRIVDPEIGAVTLGKTHRTPEVPKPERRPGRWKGLVPPPPDDFFEPMTEDELKDWYGE